MNLKSILQRAFSGAIYAGIIIGCLYLGSYAVIALAAVFGCLAVVEFTKITSGGSLHGRMTSTVIDCLGVLAVILAFLSIAGESVIMQWAICIIIVLVRCVQQLYLKSEDPVRELSLSMMKYCYIGVPLGCMAALGNAEFSHHFILAIFLMIWINDTGAFLVGCTFGKHRLFERLSPKKSWEGFFGGLVFTCALAYLFSRNTHLYFGLPADPVLWIGLGVVVTVFATWGDLMESMIKRSLQIKDSGHIMPGHGGILDRIDSLLFVMPASAIYAYIYLTLTT